MGGRCPTRLFGPRVTSRKRPGSSGSSRKKQSLATRSSGSTSPRWRSTAPCTKALLEAKELARTRPTGRSSVGSGPSSPNGTAFRSAWPRSPDPIPSGLLRSCFPPRLLTGMALRQFGLPACSVRPEGPPPSLAQHGSWQRPSPSPSLPFRDAHPLSPPSYSRCPANGGMVRACQCWFVSGWALRVEDGRKCEGLASRPT